MLCEQHHKLQFVQVHWIWKSNIIEFRISQGRNSLSFPPTTMKVASSLSQWIKTNLFMSLPWNFCFTWLYGLCTASWDEEIYQAFMDSVEACENIETIGGGDVNDELMTLLSSILQLVVRSSRQYQLLVHVSKIWMFQMPANLWPFWACWIGSFALTRHGVWGILVWINSKYSHMSQIF